MGKYTTGNYRESGRAQTIVANPVNGPRARARCENGTKLWDNEENLGLKPNTRSSGHPRVPRAASGSRLYPLLPKRR